MFVLSGQNNPNTELTSGAFKPKKLSLCVAILSCSLSQSLWALGLGEIHSSSLLGEQLRARIAVIGDDQSLTADEVRVSRLNVSEAERLGIDLMSDGRDIKVRAIDTDQGVALDVSSHQIIHEPFLNFVVKLEWPSGSVYREYTVLLDLPVTPSQSSAASSNAAFGGQSNVLQSNVDQSNSSAHQANANVSPKNTPLKSTSLKSTAQSASERYRVQIGDSLLSLAEQWLRHQGSGSSGASLESVAQWLLDHNPQAFAGGNANQLMAGALLAWPVGDGLLTTSHVSRIANTVAPSGKTDTVADLIANVTTQVGVVLGTQVAASSHHSRSAFTVGGEEPFIHTPADSLSGLSLGGDQWQLVPTPQSSQSLNSLPWDHQYASQIEPNASRATASATQTAGARLRLGTTPNRIDDATMMALSEEGIQESLAAVVQSQLDVTHEVIDRLRRDNTDLRDQLTRLEQSEYLTTLTELVRLQGLQLAALQAQQQSQMGSRVELNTGNGAGGSLSDTQVAEATEWNAQTSETPASSPVVASILAEVYAAGLASYAPAAQGTPTFTGSTSGFLNLNSLVAAPAKSAAMDPTGIDRRAINVPNASAANTTIDTATWLRWASFFLAPLVLMGVYIMVVFRREQRAEQAAARAADIDRGAAEPVDATSFSLESLADLTLAQHTNDPTGFNASLAAFRQQASESLVTDKNELLDRQTMAALLEKSLRQAEAHQTHLPDLSRNLVSAEASARQVDKRLDEAFSGAMRQVFTEQSLARRSADHTTSERGEPQLLLPEVQPGTRDNVIPFGRRSQSDEELKRRIHDKVCHYHPPKPEEADYIVKEGVENIEQYLNIEMINTPQINLDESQDKPSKD